MQQEKQERVETVLRLLDKLSTKAKVEVLANVFIRLGLSKISTEENIDKLNIADVILRDIENNGQTLPNALARQGLLILTWLKED
jgi:hypothetical protein